MFCPRCGHRVVAPFGTPGPADNSVVAVPVQSASYAGFWKRLGAFVIDYIIIIVGTVIIGFAFGLTFAENLSGDELEVFGNLIGIVVVWLYYALMKS